MAAWTAGSRHIPALSSHDLRVFSDVSHDDALSSVDFSSKASLIFIGKPNTNFSVFLVEINLLLMVSDRILAQVQK